MSQTTSTDTAQWTDSLIALLERQQQLVDQLLELAQTQSSLIDDGRTDRLLDLLAKRQSIIDEFTQAQSQLTEMTGGFEDQLTSVGQDSRGHIRKLIGDIGDRLGRVMKRDEEDQSALKSDRDEVQSELVSVGTAQKARQAYTGRTDGATRFADKHG